MKNLYVVLLLAIGGCASLSNQVFEDVHKGDSEDHVREKLGTPNSFRASQKVEGATVWAYYKRGQECDIMLKDKAVLDFACASNPNYVNPVAAGIGGMAKGIGDSQKSSTVNCQSYQNGNLTNTTCN